MTRPSEHHGATRRSYDAVAARYAAEIGGELAGKPLDRALLAALAELAAGGTIGDLGCGPGHVAGHLAARGSRALGVDLSVGMCGLAAADHGVPAAAGDLLALPLRAASLAAIVCWYALIHLDEGERALAYGEMARVLRPGGVALVAFHTADADAAPGDTRAVSEWWGEPVSLRFRFLDPDGEVSAAGDAGLSLVARLDRQPGAGEHPSRRTYLLLGRRAGGAGG